MNQLDTLLALPSLQRRPLPDLAMLGVVPDPKRVGPGRTAVLRALWGGADYRGRLQAHGLNVESYVAREAARLSAMRGQFEQLRSLAVRPVGGGKGDRLLIVRPSFGPSRKRDAGDREALAGLLPPALEVTGGVILSG